MGSLAPFQCESDCSRMALVAPSILAADFADLAAGLHVIEASGAPIIHVDIMDGHFVPEISVGQPVLASLRRATSLTLDVHLQIERPERYIRDYAQAGATWVSVPAEEPARLYSTLRLIKSCGLKAGVALGPGTPVHSVCAVLNELDFLNLQCAEPGLRDLPWVPQSLDRVSEAARMRRSAGANFELEAEGGIGLSDAEALAEAGADILVVGSIIFHNQDPVATLVKLVKRVASTGSAVV